MKVELSKIVDAIEMAGDAFEGYYDFENGDCVWLSDPLYSGETDEELAALIENSTGRFLRLPSTYDIHKYNIMENFIETLPAGSEQNRLARAIRGKGAFRRFKDEIIRLGIVEQWYKYQADAYRELATRWCRDNELEWTE
ncbi:MAG: UPF0158 family protein [Eubacteriales bacterium]|nr:UPF0158 family protein [Eubacteriales bacterium]